MISGITEVLPEEANIYSENHKLNINRKEIPIGAVVFFVKKKNLNGRLVLARLKNTIHTKFVFSYTISWTHGLLMVFLMKNSRRLHIGKRYLKIFQKRKL